MKIRQFRSILALAAVTASFTISLAPSQAFTLDDLLNVVKQGIQSTPSSGFSQQQSSSETQQAGGFNNDAPQPQIPQPQTTQPQETSPPQNRYPSPSSSSPRSIALQSRCTTVSGPDWFSGVGRDDPDAMISVGQRALRATSLLKTEIYSYSPHIQQTCAITRHPTSETIGLIVVIPDDSTINSVRISLFVDGEEKISRTVARGQAKVYPINIAGANSYAYTMKVIGDTNSSGKSNNVYFAVRTRR
jgi:hypothetical protein